MNFYRFFFPRILSILRFSPLLVAPWQRPDPPRRKKRESVILLVTLADISPLNVDAVPGAGALGDDVAVPGHIGRLDDAGAEGFPWARVPAIPCGTPPVAPPTGGKPPMRRSSRGSSPATSSAVHLSSRLVELPMSPISDVGRVSQRPLAAGGVPGNNPVGSPVGHRRRAVFCFLGHPSCLVATDPSFRTIEMICDLVHSAGDRMPIVDLQSIAQRVAE